MTKHTTLKSIAKNKTTILIVALAVLGLFVLSSTPTQPSDLGEVKLTGNQIQPVAYKVHATTSTLIPFKTAMVYDMRDGTWSSIVVSQNSVKISSQSLTNPQYKLYPTVQQLQEFETILTKVNMGTQTVFDKIKLTIIWMQMKKTKGV